MKKSVVLSFVTLSSLILTSLVQAEELTPVSPETSLVTVQPEVVSPVVDVPVAVDSSQTVSDVVPPVETVSPVVDVTNPVSEISPETSPTVVSETSSASSVPQVAPSSNTPVIPDQTSSSSVDVESPVKVEATTETRTESQGISEGQAGSTSQVTGQVIQVVTPQAPVTMDKGQVIVGTQDSQLIVETRSGERQVLAPEQVGARKNADGTISVKTSKGQLVTLPKAGETNSAVLSLIGSVILTVLGFHLRRSYRHF